MIITRTPFRISFFGGGTDYPAYYREHGGAVLSTTINKYCYITCRYLPPFFAYNYRIRYTRVEEVDRVEDIRHPSVRECLRVMRISEPIEMLHTSDIPAMSGIGSSSSFTVGFLHALHGLRGKMLSKRQLASLALDVEQRRIGEAVGSQDQFAAAFGGFNRIDFDRKGDIRVQPMILSPDNLAYLQDCLLFYFTGYARIAAEVAGEQIRNTPHKTAELGHMHRMVDEAITLLGGSRRAIDAFGRLLHEEWQLKRSLTDKISTPAIDAIYARARAAGALGGKICGAGGGGFMVFFVPPDAQAAVKAALADLLLVPVRFENLGSHVIFYAAEDAAGVCCP